MWGKRALEGDRKGFLVLIWVFCLMRLYASCGEREHPREVGEDGGWLPFPVGNHRKGSAAEAKESCRWVAEGMVAGVDRERRA